MSAKTPLRYGESGEHNNAGSDMTKWTLVAALTAIALCLGGCASTPPQLPVPLAQDATTGKAGRIGVAMKALPAVDNSFPGAYCLLCLAAASIANSQVTSYAKTLPLEDLPKLKQDIAARLRKSGAEVVVIDEPLPLDGLPTTGSKLPNVASQNFASVKDKYRLDKLLVVEINTIGFERTYQAYIPSSDPKAVFRGRAFLVNLSNNAYEWYVPINIYKSSDSAWDEPPKFPGLSNAYFQTLELGRDAILKPLGD